MMSPDEKLDFRSCELCHRI